VFAVSSESYGDLLCTDGVWTAIGRHVLEENLWARWVGTSDSVRQQHIDPPAAAVTAAPRITCHQLTGRRVTDRQTSWCDATERIPTGS